MKVPLLGRIEELRSNKSKKGNQPYVYLLEEAFAKATERDLDQINFLKKDGNPAHLEEIYQLYQNLQSRQERIKPLLPLPLIDENRNAVFKLKVILQKL